MKRFLQILIAVAILAPMTAGAQTTSVEVTYSWTAPTSGSPVVKYGVEKSFDAGATWSFHAFTTNATPSIAISVPVLQSIQIRVYGVDALNRQGIKSTPSDPYLADPGVPGACGKPSRS